MGYMIEIRARTGCGCEAHVEFDLEDPPAVGTVAALLRRALDPDETELYAFLAEEHAHGGHEKITIEATVKVR